MRWWAPFEHRHHHHWWGGYLEKQRGTMARLSWRGTATLSESLGHKGDQIVHHPCFIIICIIIFIIVCIIIPVSILSSLQPAVKKVSASMITQLDRELEITGDSGSGDVVVRAKITSWSARERSRVNETWIEVSSATTLYTVSIPNSLTLLGTSLVSCTTRYPVGIIHY